MDRMNRFSMLAASVALCVCAAGVAAQDAIPLSQDEAMALVNGKKLETRNARFGAVRLDLREGGRVYGSNQGQSDSGQWRVEGGKLCLQWRQWDYTGCGVLQRRGAVIEHLNPDGTLHFTVSSN